MTDLDQGDPAAHEQEVHEPTAEEIAAQERAERMAEYMAHPHTRLTEIQKSLATPGHDINDRVGTLHQAVSRLLQVIMQHTPGAPRHPDAPEEALDGEG